jgi:hypothetical protein
MVCSQCGHSNDLISKPGTPGVMRASLILAWHFGQRGSSIAENGGFLNLDIDALGDAVAGYKMMAKAT